MRRLARRSWAAGRLAVCHPSALRLSTARTAVDMGWAAGPGHLPYALLGTPCWARFAGHAMLGTLCWARPGLPPVWPGQPCPALAPACYPKAAVARNDCTAILPPCLPPLRCSSPLQAAAPLAPVRRVLFLDSGLAGLPPCSPRPQLSQAPGPPPGPVPYPCRRRRHSHSMPLCARDERWLCGGSLFPKCLRSRHTPNSNHAL